MHNLLFCSGLILFKFLFKSVQICVIMAPFSVPICVNKATIPARQQFSFKPTTVRVEKAPFSGKIFFRTRRKSAPICFFSALFKIGPNLRHFGSIFGREMRQIARENLYPWISELSKFTLLGRHFGGEKILPGSEKHYPSTLSMIMLVCEFK